MRFIIIICFLLLFFTNAFSKILIFTYAFNRPEFIEMQHKTFQKFLKDDYEFVIFSDAKTDRIHNSIKSMCDRYKLSCIRIPQEIHDRPYLERPKTGYMAEYHSPSVRNCNVVQYSLDTLGFKHDDILVLIDSDMFLIRELNIREYLRDFELAGCVMPCNGYPPHTCKVAHPGISPFKYVWIGLVFLDMSRLPNKNTINFNCGYVYGKVMVDSGGYTAYYLNNNPSVRVKDIARRSLEYMVCEKCKKKPKPGPGCTHNYDILHNYGLDEKAIKFAQSMPMFSKSSKDGRPSEFLMRGVFLHYRGGTNYHNFSSAYHAQKTQLFKRFIEDLI